MANTGFFRRYKLKKNEVRPSGFTYTLITQEYSLLTGFTYVDINNVSTTYPEITEQDLSYMTNAEYGQRLVDFLSFLNINLSDQSILITGSTGYDPVLCPLPIPTTTTTTTSGTTTTTTLPTTTTTTTLPLSVISGYTFGGVGGDYRLWSTSDGGTNWNLVDLSGYSANTNTLYSGVAVDNENIFIVGQNGILLYTDDNGINWYEKIISPSLLHIISKTSNNYLYAGGQEPNTLYISNDLGVSWSGITFSGQTTGIRDIYFIDDNTGYLATGVMGYGNVFKTTDGGLNWVSISGSTTFDDQLFSVYFIDENNGFIGGNDDRFYKTTDGGANWVKISGSTTLWNSTVDIRRILFFNDGQLGFAVGNGTFLGSVIYRTIDGGVSWENVYSSSGIGVYGIGYFDKNRWWFSTGNGSILYTDDMGDNFTVNQLVTAPPTIFYIFGLIIF